MSAHKHSGYCLALLLLFAAAVVPIGASLRSVPRGRFRLAHPAPIYQDLTRAAFLHRSGRGPGSLHFSTLESYHRNPRGDKALLVSRELDSGRTGVTVVPGSIEARRYAYSRALGRYVLGTSLDPQLFLYDPDTRGIEHVFSGRPSDGFVHGLAVRGTDAYAIFSRPEKKPGLGLLKVDLKTGKAKTIPFVDDLAQGWAGVQTVDPSDRVWFYQAYPLRPMWHDASGGTRPRHWPGYEGWNVESWDTWKGREYLLLTNRRGGFVKLPVDLSALKSRPAPDEPSSQLFLESIRVDLHHNGGPALDGLYFHPKSSSFYLKDPSTDDFALLGKLELGEFQLMGFNDEPQESPVAWKHPALGEVEALGTAPDGGLIVWLRGRRAFARAGWNARSLKLEQVEAPVLSPAEITSLAAGADGLLYGGGALTMSHLFRFDPETGEARLLRGAVPNSEGQVNSLISGRDGKMYGAAYPDSVLFRFDPTKPWKPGRAQGSNPLNLGPMGHRRQMRASKGVQDLDGAVWYQSVSDYSFPPAHALAKADFSRRTLTVKTDVDDGFPQVDDLAVFDRDHLLLLGRSGGRGALFLLDQRAFKAERARDLPQAGGTLVNLASEGSEARLFLAQSGTLYRVGRDLSLAPIHELPEPILKILAGTGDEVILIGRTRVETFDPRTGKAAVWWSGRSWAFGSDRGKPGGFVYRHASWVPAVFRKGVLQIADEDKIWTFYPPPAS